MSGRPGLRTYLSEFGITAGTFGSTSGQTVMVALLPILIARYADSAFMVGLAIGGEGALALAVPYWIGLLSDRLPHALVVRFGRRMFFLLVMAPIMAAALSVAPFLHGYWPLAGAALVFFAALHGYLTPLWTLMIDAVPEERRGRVQGVRGVLHSAGLAFALVAGGLLFSLWHPLPFLLAALFVLVTTGLTWHAANMGGRDREAHMTPSGAVAHPLKALKENPAATWFLAANALWSGGVDGIRPYFFVYASVVIGITTAEASLVLTLLVVGLGLGSVVVGWVGDVWGGERLLLRGVTTTGIALVLGVAVRTLPGAVLLLLIAGAGAAAILALPYPLFARIVGGESMGRNTGLYVLSTGFGRMAAPMLVGAAIDFGARYLPQYRGYPFMWPLAGALMLGGAAALSVSLRKRVR